MRDEQDFRVLYRRFIQLGRWLLLLVCLVAGLYLLVGEKSIGFGILFLLAVLWLILDNPLESFATLGVHDSSNVNSQSDEGEEVLADFSQREAVVVGPSDTLDLHTFSPKEVPSLLEEFIHQSQRAEIYLVKIVHGKGSGALRRRVQALLARDRRVLAFYDAPRKSGGWGATVVELLPRQEGESDESSS
ncbi:MAG: Smr/MutS family protein [Syntrophobacteria bacterium]|jgi:hypothetical protein